MQRLVLEVKWQNFDFALGGRLDVSFKMLLHSRGQSWAWMVSRTSPTMKTRLEDGQRKGVGEGTCLDIVVMCVTLG